MTPGAFIAKWRASELKESSAAQEHFIDLCRLLDEPTPAEGDPTGERYCFERGARKDIGGDGWADVWETPPLRLGVQGQARRPRYRVQPAAPVRARPREPAAAHCLRHGAFPHPHQLDEQRQRDPRVHPGRPLRRRHPRQAQVGDVRPRPVAAGRDPPDAHRARCGHLRNAGSITARARPRTAGGGALRPPAGLLHVRRGRRPAAGQHVHAHAGARTPTA